MDLRCVQEAMRIAYYERDRRRGLHATFTWLVEEVGELAEAVLEEDRRKVEEEIADVSLDAKHSKPTRRRRRGGYEEEVRSRPRKSWV